MQCRLRAPAHCSAPYPVVDVRPSGARVLEAANEAARPVPQVFLIMELLLGGELLDAVLAKGSYSEADARLCFVQLLRGVHYLHSR